MEIELSKEELSELAEIVQSYSADLVSELQHTENHEFRRRLKEERQVVSVLLQKIRKMKFQEGEPFLEYGD